MLSIIRPIHVSLPNLTPALSLVNVSAMSKISNPSVTSSQVTDTLALPSVAPAFIVILNVVELKSIPDPNSIIVNS